MSVSLFVYGTLLAGERLAGLLGDSERYEATVFGTLYRLPAGYPALRLGGDTRVHGELVNGVDSRKLQLIDHYEGVAQGLFQRIEVDAVSGLRKARAWVWVMDAPRLRGGVLIPSGRWTAIRRR